MAKSVYTDQCLEAIDRWSGMPEAPNPWSRQFPRGIPLMKNRLAEKVIGQAHPITPGIWFGPFIIYGLYKGFAMGQIGMTIGLFIAGWLIWSLLEYVLHRWVFHYVASSQWGKKQMFFIHGYHHEFPSDGMRLVAPIFMSWPLAVVFALVYYLFLGPNHWLQLFAGSAAGYLAYDWIHYYTHHFTPRNPIGKFLRKYHMLHHYKDGEAYFGISSPLWDFVFGTFKSTKSTSAGSDEPLKPAMSARS